MPLSVIGRVVAGHDLPVFRMNGLERRLRCRLLPAFLILPSRRLPATTPRQAQCPSSSPPPWRSAASSPAIVVSLGGLVGQALATEQGTRHAPGQPAQSRAGARHHPGRHAHAQAGRRIGYMVGAGIGVAGGCLAAFGIASGSFVLFCLGTLIVGSYGSFVQSYRFAATDAASEAFKPRAISWVMAGGLVGRHRRSADGDLDPGCGSRRRPSPAPSSGRRRWPSCR